MTDQTAEQQLTAIRRQMAAPGPTLEQQAEWDTADQAMARRIRTSRPGVPLHHAFATLQTLRTIQWIDAAAEERSSRPDPVEGGHEAALGQAREEIRRLGLMIDEYGTGASALSDKLGEARMWARHGYEIGQRHCSWTDHGVAPAWLTEGGPHHFDSCEHLKQAAEYDETITRVRAEVARIRSITRTWWPVADLIDAALNGQPVPSGPDVPVPDDSGPADLTGYLAPEPAVRCLTITTVEPDSTDQAEAEPPCCSDPTCACVQVNEAGRCDCARWEAPDPGASRWLHVTITNPDAYTANRSALSLVDWLTAEFDGVAMQITTNAREWGDSPGATLATEPACNAPGPWGDAHACQLPADHRGDHEAHDGCGWVDEQAAAQHPEPVTTEPAPDNWPSRRTGLRDQLAAAIHRYDNHALSGNDIPSQHHRGEADAVLTVLYREWPWLRAEAEDRLTASEAERLAYEADKAQDTLMLARERCDAAEADGNTTVDIQQVRGWLDGARCARMLSAQVRQEKATAGLREQLHAAIESELYEYRERTMWWPETGGVTQEIARLATRGAMEVRDREMERLRAELDRAHTELRWYAEAESADAAAGSYALRAEHAEQQRDQLAAVLAEILAAFHPVHTADRRTVTGYTARVTPADHKRWTAMCGQQSEPDAWTPPPPGSTSEQLPDTLLALILDQLPDYTSTACQTADTLACTATHGHPLYDEIREHAERLHSRCRLNMKFTGQLCACGCHPPKEQP